MQIQSFGFWEILQQIINFLIIDLQERTEYSEFGFSFLMNANLIKKFVYSSWD